MENKMKKYTIEKIMNAKRDIEQLIDRDAFDTILNNDELFIVSLGWRDNDAHTKTIIKNITQALKKHFSCVNVLRQHGKNCDVYGFKCNIEAFSHDSDF